MGGSNMELSFRTMMYVGCGCFVGGVLRYITAVVISSGWGITEVDMPWHTLFINFGGCLFMGIFCAMGVHGLIESPNLRAALMTGLCGGYSTLASFALENTFIFRAGHHLTALIYITATLVGSIVCFILGYLAAGCLTRG